MMFQIVWARAWVLGHPKREGHSNDEFIGWLLNTM